MKTQHLKDLASRLCEAIPENLRMVKNDLEKNFHAILLSTFAKLELVTREEFDAQTKVLLRTRKKLENLEVEVKVLEQKLNSEKNNET